MKQVEKDQTQEIRLLKCHSQKHASHTPGNPQAQNTSKIYLQGVRAQHSVLQCTFLQGMTYTRMTMNWTS